MTPTPWGRTVFTAEPAQHGAPAGVRGRVRVSSAAAAPPPQHERGGPAYEDEQHDHHRQGHDPHSPLINRRVTTPTHEPLGGESAALECLIAADRPLPPPPAGRPGARSPCSTVNGDACPVPVAARSPPSPDEVEPPGTRRSAIWLLGPGEDPWRSRILLARRVR
jgi:hypothetical protein